ncbi:ABC transporter substrate-binding protein, partial [Paracoccus sp. (in: a-proteobacteria)]
MTMINRRAFTASLLAAVPATGFLGKSVLAQTMRDITFVQPSPSAINSFPVFVAIGEGYFAQEGLNVNVEAINGSGAVLQALSAGQAQFGRPGPGPLLAARSRGVDAVHIYNVAARSNFGIAVQDDSDFQ